MEIIPIAPETPIRSRAAAEQVAQQFEAVFLAEMLRPVFSSMETGLTGGGAGEEIIKPLLADAYGEAIAKAGGIGIADTILSEILQMQGLQMQGLAK